MDQSGAYSGADNIQSKANEKLIKEYLDIAVNSPENFDRFSKLLTDDCVWRIMPPGFTFNGIEQVKSFSKMAMGSRAHNENIKLRFSTGSLMVIIFVWSIFMERS